MSKYGFGTVRKKPERERPQQGAALFFWAWKEHFWALMRLNFIVILFCLPIITICPAICAMNRVLYRMIAGEPQLLWTEFWATFRKECKRSLLVAIPMLLLAILLIWAGGLFRPEAEGGWQSLLALLGLMVLVIFGSYVCAIIPYIDITIGQTLKNAGIFLLLCFSRNLLTTLLLGGLGFLFWVLSPVSTPILVISIVPIFGYSLAYCTYGGVYRYLASASNKVHDGNKFTGTSQL